MTTKRAVRGLLYASLTLAGAVGLEYPPEALLANTGPFWAKLWAFYLIAGGLIALTSVFSDRWMGEYVALPLLASGVAFDAIAILMDTGQHPLRTVAGVLLGTLTIALLDRWLDVKAVARAAGVVPPHERT